MEFLPKMANNGLCVRYLLGFSPVLEKCGEMSISYLMKHGFGSSRSYQVLILKQRAPVVVLVILVITIMANRRDSIKLDVLASFRRINRVTNYT